MTANINLKQMRQSLRSSNQAKTIRVAHSDIGYLYRYDTSWVQNNYGASQPIFQCWEYPIISETNHTYLISTGSEKKRIYKDNPRGWAHRTIVAARFHYVKRKRNQLDIIEQQRDNAIAVLKALCEDWGTDVGELPGRQSIQQVYAAELEAQRLEDESKRINDLYGEDLFTP